MQVLLDIFHLFLERKEFFMKLLVEHLLLSGLAIMLSFCLGLLLGILISEIKPLASFVLLFVNIIYTIPSISMLGFLIIFMGIGNYPAITALVMYGLLPMISSTYTGINQTDADVLEAAKGMGCTRMQILFRIKIPLGLPVILSGLRTMIVMTVSLAGIASFVGAGGLGVAIYRGITTNNVSMTLLGSMMIALLAIVLDLLCMLINKKIIWKRSLE